MGLNYPNTPKPSSMLSRIASGPALYGAWRKVRANRGAAGVDAVGINAFERNLEANLKELGRNLVDGSYLPLPARHVSVLKPDGRQREIAILTVRDRVAQRAVLDEIEPLFESQFLDCSFAFRPERSVEMAIQRLVVNRAQGFVWTVDADLENFFGTLDHSLLLEELGSSLGDRDVLMLIGQWLEAGALDGGRPTMKAIVRWHASLAGMSLAVRDSVSRLLDEFVSDRLGIGGIEDSSWPGSGDLSAGEANEEAPGSGNRSGLRRAALGRLAQDGLLLALTERAALRGLLSAKALGVGGVAVALALAAPFAVRKLKKMNSPKGTLQGAPLSPLLSNVYMHPFDAALTSRGRRLVRYCDDFVIVCRTEEEARESLGEARETLEQRGLRLSQAKTRVVCPMETFEFLGHRFTPDGRVVPPPSLPEVVTRRMIDYAERHRARAATRIRTAGEQARGLLGRVREAVRRR